MNADNDQSLPNDCFSALLDVSLTAATKVGS